MRLTKDAVVVDPTFTTEYRVGDLFTRDARYASLAALVVHVTIGASGDALAFLRHAMLEDGSTSPDAFSACAFDQTVHMLQVRNKRRARVVRACARAFVIVSVGPSF